MYQVQEVFGWWERGLSAGGSRNDLEKFAINPQYMLTISQPGKTYIQINVTQNYKRLKKKTCKYCSK